MMGFGAAGASRVVVARATKGGTSGGVQEEKGIFDWIIGGLQKQDQFYETDPILQKVEDKNNGSPVVGGRKGTVSIPLKKKDGFGGLFAKN